MSKVVRLNEKDIEGLVRRIMSEDKQSKTVDMKGKKCTNCKKGKYGETSQLDDLEGVLHCTNCGEKTDRYVDKTVKESWPKRELDRKATNFRRGDFDPYKREKDVQKIFGKYSEDVPPQVIQYMRKNPASIIRRLVDIYGIDEVYNYIDMATGDTMPPMEESYNIFGNKRK